MTIEDYMKQASMTADYYAHQAKETLDEIGLPYTAADVVALAAVAARDFETMMRRSHV